MSAESEYEINEVAFENGRKARTLNASQAGEARTWLKELGLGSPRRVIWLSGSAGGFDPALAAPLKNLFIRSVLKVAARSDIQALIMDGGTASGVMSVMGSAVADDDFRVPLLGVAPRGAVSLAEQSQTSQLLDPHHSHFALVPGKAFGDEVPWMGKIAAALSTPTEGDKLPVVMILAGGNPKGISKLDVLTAVRAGYPVIVIRKTKGLADKLASLEKKQHGNPFFITRWLGDWFKAIAKNLLQIELKSTLDRDQELVEIMESGNLYFCALDDAARETESLLQKVFVAEENKHKKALLQAWQRFAIYDRQASVYQNRFQQLQDWILRFAVLATFLAVSYSVFFPAGSGGSIWKTALNWLVIGTPLIGSGMLAYLNKVNSGIKFIFLRGAAETLKQAIYTYRTRDPQERIIVREGEKGLSREQELGLTVESVSRQLMDSPVNQAGLPAYNGKLPPAGAIENMDDGLSDLSAASYVRLRLVHQRAWHQNKTALLEKSLNRLNFWIILFGMAGTFIAAIGLEAWVAVTTSIVTALSAYLNYRQTEQTLVGYNQTATHLQNIEVWFNSLTAAEQKRAANIALLVSTTEKVLATEVAVWVQNMKDTIESLKLEPQAAEEE